MSAAKHRLPSSGRGRRVSAMGLSSAALVVAVASTVAASEPAPLRDPAPQVAATQAAQGGPGSPVITSVVAAATATEGQTAQAASPDEVAARAATKLPDLASMTLDQLRVTSAKVQAEFVTSSLALQEARQQVAQAEAEVEAATQTAEQAQAEAETARMVVATQVTESYMSEAAASPVSRALSGDSETLSEVLDASVRMQQFSDATATAIRDFDTAQAEADAQAQAAEEAAAAADAAAAEAEALLDDIQERAEAVAVAAAAVTDSDDPTLASAEQEARNTAALTTWQASQRRISRVLAKRGITPPRAAALANPSRLPNGLKPLVGADGKPVKGVATLRHKGEALTVLPRQTVKAVDRAFKRIGKPYVTATAGPETFDCTGLVTSSWRGKYAVKGKAPVRLLKTTAVVNNKNVQVGDLVFFTSPGDGVQHVGINLGGRFMLTADAATAQVGVQQFPSAVFAATRPVLAVDRHIKIPKSPADAASRCGGMNFAASGALLGWPVDPDVFRFSATFGQKGSLWASGAHTGLDLAAPSGTPVYAAKGGTVRVAASSWAGPHHVTIDHGDGFATAYAHMKAATVKTGDKVAAGQQIGLVGSLGNSKGPHLHLEVLVDGVKVDPALFLPGSKNGPGWGGFSNGMIPSTALCGLDGTAHVLRCDAATAWNAMSAAYAKQFGTGICITDSYRSFAGQVRLYAQKPTLAAVPGTSNHGWALATDLCGGIESFTSPQHAWMVANAPKFGWLHPQWARRGGGREEPWHWEFGQIS